MDLYLRRYTSLYVHYMHSTLFFFFWCVPFAHSSFYSQFLSLGLIATDEHRDT